MLRSAAKCPSVGDSATRTQEVGRLAPPYGNVSLFVTTGELAARGAGRAGGTRAEACLGALADGGKEGRAR